MEKQIEEIGQLFKEISLMVDSQGEMVNNIYQNLLISCPEIEKGRLELMNATKSQKAARKKKILLVIFGFIVLVIIILIIAIN